MKKYLLFPLCAALCLLAGCADDFPTELNHNYYQDDTPPAEPDITEQTVKLGTYNLWISNKGTGDYVWTHRRDILAQSIVNNDWDIFGFQEANSTIQSDLPPLVAAIPYIMPKRYDAWNSITENIDEEAVKAYIRHWRREGVRLNHMSVIIAAYYRAVLDNPKLNYFVMNGKIYRRNHFCVSFVILKKRSDGVVNETTLKVYLDENDTVFTVNQKIKDAIDANKAEHQSNSTDKFAKFMFSVPGLPKFVVWLAYHLDKHGLLPRKIIDLSSFHTSMFITNLASIKTSYIHHHCYEFGTTSVFVCMGKPVPDYMGGDLTRKVMPIGVVMDERICTGYEYAAFCNDFRRYV
mgnify:CR=1 FL=1